MIPTDNLGTQKLRQNLKLAAHQVQLMNMVTMSATELSQCIMHELEENPALEEGVEADARDYDNSEHQDGLTEEQIVLGDYASEEEVPDTTLNKYSQYRTSATDIPFASEQTLQEHLIEQLPLLSFDTEEVEIATFIVGSLDDNGFLRRKEEVLSDDLILYQGIVASVEKIQEVIDILQKELDPPGVVARDLQECLLIQLNRRRQGEKVDLAKIILSQYFEPFTKHRYEWIQETLNITAEELREAVRVITTLNPAPGRDFSSRLAEGLQLVVPDFEVREDNGELQVTLYRGDIPEVRISRSYSEEIQAMSSQREIKEAKQFVRKKVGLAKTFIQLLKLRENAMMKTMMAIVSIQREFFMTGETQLLRPMILKDIAEKTGYDISTISRVTSTKYVATDFGVYPLRYFFTDAMLNESGEEVSIQHIKELIYEIISDEDKQNPLSDDDIRERLLQKGFKIARRTVAKYRDQMNLPIARLRKEI